MYYTNWCTHTGQCKYINAGRDLGVKSHRYISLGFESMTLHYINFAPYSTLVKKDLLLQFVFLLENRTIQSALKRKDRFKWSTMRKKIKPMCLKASTGIWPSSAALLRSLMALLKEHWGKKNECSADSSAAWRLFTDWREFSGQEPKLV